jgi:WD40 repeat protein
MKPLAELSISQTNPPGILFRDEDTLLIRTGWLIRIWNWRTNRVVETSGPPTLGLQNLVLRRLVLSPDRRRIALLLLNRGSLSTARSTVSIWDRELTTEVGRLPPGDYSALAFNPDGRRIVTVGEEESVVRIWDGDQFRPLLTLADTDSHVGGVAFTRAGQIVAARTKGGLTIWDTQVRPR